MVLPGTITASTHPVNHPCMNGLFPERAELSPEISPDERPVRRSGDKLANGDPRSGTSSVLCQRVPMLAAFGCGAFGSLRLGRGPWLPMPRVATPGGSLMERADRPTRRRSRWGAGALVAVLAVVLRSAVRSSCRPHSGSGRLVPRPLRPRPRLSPRRVPRPPPRRFPASSLRRRRVPLRPLRLRRLSRPATATPSSPCGPTPTTTSSSATPPSPTPSLRASACAPCPHGGRRREGPGLHPRARARHPARVQQHARYRRAVGLHRRHPRRRTAAGEADPPGRPSPVGHVRAPPRRQHHRRRFRRHGARDVEPVAGRGGSRHSRRSTEVPRWTGRSCPPH